MAAALVTSPWEMPTQASPMALAPAMLCASMVWYSTHPSPGESPPQLSWQADVQLQLLDLRFS